MELAKLICSCCHNRVFVDLYTGTAYPDLVMINPDRGVEIRVTLKSQQQIEELRGALAEVILRLQDK